jgi:hypothetical protein
MKHRLKALEAKVAQDGALLPETPDRHPACFPRTLLEAAAGFWEIDQPQRQLGLGSRLCQVGARGVLLGRTASGRPRSWRTGLLNRLFIAGSRWIIANLCVNMMPIYANISRRRVPPMLAEPSRSQRRRRPTGTVALLGRDATRRTFRPGESSVNMAKSRRPVPDHATIPEDRQNRD